MLDHGDLIKSVSVGVGIHVKARLNLELGRNKFNTLLLEIECLGAGSSV